MNTVEDAVTYNMDTPLTTFNGGLKPPEHKNLSTGTGISKVAQCKQYIIPLQQHIGAISQPLVKPGDKVLKGQMLAQPGNLISAAIHSPVSGLITDIKPHEIPHISGLTDLCVFIENDFKNEWIERQPLGDEFNQATSSALRKIIRDAGIVGLGGATFPAAVKQTEVNVNTLILNGVECEPYITCDDVLMRERAKEVLSGAEIISHIIKARQCLIAIEDNKPEAIHAINQIIEKDGTGFFQIKIIPTVYPSGGEKQLIKIITGKEVPEGHYPGELGVLCHNVATAYAIHRAIYCAEPLISRICTVTGYGIKQPQNIEVLIGTSIQSCIEHCGGYSDNSDELIMGGPMMGFSLNTDTLPVVKATNCLLANAHTSAYKADLEDNIKKRQHLPCIRCGRCVDVCPVRLLPQQLYWYASSKNIDRLEQHHLFDCIECGCCAYVCPSNIPLVQYYRFAKTTILQQQREHQASDIARLRHEANQSRKEKIKREREEKLRKKREMLKNKAASSKNAGNETNANKNNKQAVIAEAIARAQAKKAERDKK